MYLPSRGEMSLGHLMNNALGTTVFFVLQIEFLHVTSLLIISHENNIWQNNDVWFLWIICWDPVV